MDKLNNFEDLIKKAKTLGATASEVIFAESSSVSVNRRLRKPESLTRSEEETIGLRVFVGKKSAIVSSSDTSKEVLDDMLERAVAMAKAVPEDEFSGIADESEIVKDFPDLDLYDDTEISVEEMEDMADRAEAAAMEVEGVTNSDGAEFSQYKSGFHYLASNGFSGGYRTSDFTVAASVLAGADQNMQIDYDFTNAPFFSDLKPVEEVGRSAAIRAVEALNPQKVKTQEVPVVFGTRVSKSLIGSLAGAIKGASVARGTTMLKDKMGEEIFNPNITIVDDPFIKRGFRSYPFDSEGIAPQKRNIIENGILTGWLLDLRSARQLGLKSTGNAIRSVSSPPSARAGNFYMQPGEVSFKELIADIKQGLFVTSLMGSGVNIITGDYSRGAKGFWIENGEIAYSVAEITIAGNLKDMWKNCTPADDLVFKYGVDAPSIRVEKMTVAGS